MHISAWVRVARAPQKGERVTLFRVASAMTPAALMARQATASAANANNAAAHSPFGAPGAAGGSMRGSGGSWLGFEVRPP